MSIEAVKNAEMLVIPPVVWDGSSGADEQRCMDRFGLLIEAYEVDFWSALAITNMP